MKYRNTTDMQFLFHDVSIGLKGGETTPDMPDNLVEQSSTFKRFIEKGFLVPITETPASTVKTNVVSAAESGLEGQIDNSKLVTPDAGTGTPQQAAAPTPVSAVDPVKPSDENAVAAEGNEDSLGTFVRKDPKNPVGGSLISGEKLIQEGKRQLAQNAEELLRHNLPERFPASEQDELAEPTEGAPADMQEWFTFRHTQKKFNILSSTNQEFLKRVKQYDPNEKVKALIDQRIEELQPHEVEKNVDKLISHNLPNRHR